MGTCTVRLYGTLRRPRAPRDLQVAVRPRFTVRDLLAAVADQFLDDAAKALLAHDPERLAGSVLVVLNGRNVSADKGMDTLVGEGDVVALMPPLVGGVGGESQGVGTEGEAGGLREP